MKEKKKLKKERRMRKMGGRGEEKTEGGREGGLPTILQTVGYDTVRAHHMPYIPYLTYLT